MKSVTAALASALMLAASSSTLAQPAPSATLAAPPDAPPPRETPPGPHAVHIESAPGLPTHTVYRPQDLSAFGGEAKLPIVAWGNGACSNAGLLFANFLTQVASHGYLVIASGPKDAALPAFAAQRTGQLQPAGTVPAGRTRDEDLIKAVDWAIAENAREESPYFGKLDPTKVALMGQSCGGLQATAMAGDPRIKTVVIWNSGVFNTPGPAPGGAATQSLSGATNESLKAFHAPVAYFLGGPSDIAYANGKNDFQRVTVPAFFGSINSGHGGTFNHPGGGWYGEVGVRWLDWRLKGDAEAGRWFVGEDCVLCRDTIWEVARKNLD
ncbi:MAG: alpha/beta hydrolase [Phenylobacterium sp.]|nr:alpha/beta hydrolase [Phenylobacterium sp.]